MYQLPILHIFVHVHDLNYQFYKVQLNARHQQLALDYKHKAIKFLLLYRQLQLQTSKVVNLMMKVLKPMLLKNV